MDSSIKIVFSTRHRFISWFIRTVINKRYSHVAFLYHDPMFNCDVVAQATAESGFTITTLENFKKKDTIIAIYTPKHDITPGFQALSKYLGTMYDGVGVLGMMGLYVGRFLKRNRPKNFTHNSSLLFCSESIAYALKSMNYPGVVIDDPNDFGPEMIEAFFIAEGGIPEVP